MVRAWDHVSYSTFFFPVDLFGCSLRHLCWPWLFHWKEKYSLKPIVLQIAASGQAQGTSQNKNERFSNKNVTQIPRFHQTKTEGQMSCHRVRQTTLADHSVFFPLKFYLNMSCVRWQLNGLKTRLFGVLKIGSLRGRTSAPLKIGEILAIRKKLARF